jgi:hypothetical protein
VTTNPLVIAFQKRAINSCICYVTTGTRVASGTHMGHWLKAIGLCEGYDSVWWHGLAKWTNTASVR